MTEEKDKWIPEFLYSEDSPSNIPLVKVPKGKVMPSCIFIAEANETDNPEEEVDIFIKMFISHDSLKEKLHPDILDAVRMSIGLEPLQEAFDRGQETTNRIINAVEDAVKSKQK